jgi:hypothetical protein
VRVRSWYIVSRWRSLVQIPVARIYNLPTARMFSLVCSSDSPSGGGRTVPRTVSRTALREDPQNSDGHSESPSGGHSNSPLGKRSNLRPLYGVAHIRCHLSDRALSSRTSSHRNPDSLSALRNYFMGGREESHIMHGICERVGVELKSTSPPAYIVVEGVEGG